MIQSLKIRNFQSHKRSIINLHAGVNVIFGQSDKGKTAVIRALRWTIYNKPSGDAIRSHWGGDTEVEIKFADGNELLRKKTNSENSYTLNAEKLKAFGQGVPQEVTKAVNMDDVNIQQQHDTHFLLSETAGEVATHFNRIAGISVIDRSISKAKSAVAQTKTSIAIHEKDYVEKLDQLKMYENLDGIENVLKNIERKSKERDTLKTKIGITQTSFRRLDAITASLEYIDSIIALEPRVKNIKANDKIWIETNVALKKLRLSVSKLEKIDATLENNERILRLEQPVKNVLSKVTQKGQFEAHLKHLKTLVGKHTTLTNILLKNDETLQELVVRLPLVCPVCKGTGKLK